MFSYRGKKVGVERAVESINSLVHQFTIVLLISLAGRLNIFFTTSSSPFLRLLPITPVTISSSFFLSYWGPQINCLSNLPRASVQIVSGPEKRPTFLFITSTSMSIYFLANLISSLPWHSSFGSTLCGIEINGSESRERAEMKRRSQRSRGTRRKGTQFMAEASLPLTMTMAVVLSINHRQGV